MSNFITPERLPNRRNQALGLDVMPATGTEGFGAALEDAWVRNPTPSLVRALDRAQFSGQFGVEGTAGTDAAGMIGYQRPEPGEDFKVLSKEEANEKYGIEGRLSFDADTPEPVAEDLHRLKIEEIERQDILRRAQSGIATTVSAGLIASIVDPMNIASAFFPVVSGARYAALVGKHGVKARAGLGAAEGVAGAAALEPFVYSVAQDEQADYTAADSLMNLGFGAALGAGLHMGVGAIGDRIQAQAESRMADMLQETPTHPGIVGDTAAARANASKLQLEVEAMARTDQEAILRTAVAQVLEDRPVRVDPVLEAARRKLREKTVRLDETQTITNEEGFSETTFNVTDDNGVQKATMTVEDQGAELRVKAMTDESGTGISRVSDARVRDQMAARLKERFPDAERATLVRRGEQQAEASVPGRENAVTPDAEPEDAVDSIDLTRAREAPAERTARAQGEDEVPVTPQTSVRAAYLDSIGDPHPEYTASARAQEERAEAVKGAPRDDAETETEVAENLAEWEQMLSPEDRTRIREEFSDDEKLTRSYEKGWRLAAVCRIRNGGA